MFYENCEGLKELRTWFSVSSVSSCKYFHILAEDEDGERYTFVFWYNPKTDSITMNDEFGDIVKIQKTDDFFFLG